MEIYIKPSKKTVVTKREIFLEDIAEVFTAQSDVAKVKVFDVGDAKSKTFVVSVVDIIRILKRTFPTATVINLGESDMLVEYAPPKPRDSGRLTRWIKTALVSVILLIGSATAIMSFYTDAQMNTVFENMYYMITGVKTDNPLVIEVPYCIGLAAGIIVFFNHVGGIKLDGDPTPIEVEMMTYNNDVTDTVIHSLASQRKDQP